MRVKWRKYGLLYMVSNDGRVKNPDGKLLKPTKSSSGRLRVGLYDDHGKRYTVMIGALVLECFEEPPPWQYEKFCVGYKDGNVQNNSINNLYWKIAKGTNRWYENFEVEDISPMIKSEIINSPLFPHILAQKYNLDLKTVCKIKFRSKWRIAFRVCNQVFDAY